MVEYFNKEIEKCKNYAIKCHADVNHLYDGQSYYIHLEYTSYFANKFLHLLQKEQWSTAIKGVWCHDLIEDTRQTYNDVKQATDIETAEVAYACTNEKGKTRKERANSKYYEGIRLNKIAHYVKICDRLANIYYSKSSGSRMFEMYKKEDKHFREELYLSEFEEMFECMDGLLNKD